MNFSVMAALSISAPELEGTPVVFDPLVEIWAVIVVVDQWILHGGYHIKALMVASAPLVGL